MLAFAAEGNLVGIKGTKGDDVIRVEVITSGSHIGDLLLTLNDQQATISRSGRDHVVILGLAGNDQITIADNVPIPGLIDGGKGNDTITTNSSPISWGSDGHNRDDVILGGAGNDTIFSGTGDDKIDGGAGHDAIHAGEGDDILLGGKGNDTIHGDEGDDLIAGDAGIDALYGDNGDDNCVGGAGRDFLFGGDGQDQLYGNAGNDTLHGDFGDDLLVGDAGIDAVFGDDGNDLLEGSAGSDELHGGEGKDALLGGAGNDSLFGDNQRDHLDGGKGNDACLGGDGNDQLKGGLGKDVLDGQAGDNVLDRDQDNDALLNGIEADIDIELATYVQGVSVTYQIENRGGTIVRTFTIDPTNYTGNAWLDVFVDGVYVGHIDGAAIAAGTGRLVLSSHPIGDEQPFPDDFPPIIPGSRVQVGLWYSQFARWDSMSSGGFAPTYVI